MENADFDPKMLPVIVAGDALANDPFVLVDVGCGLGIDEAWRVFGERLTGHGFDPQVEEIERLRAEETGAMQYHAAFVGLPEDHALRRRRAGRLAEASYFEVFDRTSASAACSWAEAEGDASFYETNAWRDLPLATETIGLADVLRREGVETVDFVKIDTDGSDLDVVVSFEEMLRPAGVLGLMIETSFTGDDDESTNTFHNIDPILKRNGFQIYAMSVNQYSRAVLPARFKYEIFAQTISGQPLWGDLVYLRDVVHPDWRRFGDLSATKLLKLACLYELFQLPDCAVELLLTHRGTLGAVADVDELLELLTPPLDGEQVSYAEYVKTFAASPSRFYPPSPEPELNPEPQSEPEPTPVQRLKHLVARALGRV